MKSLWLRMRIKYKADPVLYNMFVFSVVLSSVLAGEMVYMRNNFEFVKRLDVKGLPMISVVIREKSTGDLFVRDCSRIIRGCMIRKYTEKQ